MQSTNFLRRVLVLDGLSCLGLGAMMTLGAGALAPLFGLDAALLLAAGAALLPIGAFILWLGTRRAIPATLVWLVIAGNGLWTLKSFALIAVSPAITPLGTAFVALQAIAVAGLTAMEWLDVRQSRAAA